VSDPVDVREPLLAVRDLSVSFETVSGPRLALDRVSFQVQSGGSLGIVGESGSGKSVLAKAILRILPKNANLDQKSSVQFAQTEMLQLSEPEMRRYRGARISMVFQDPKTSLNPVRTVGAQIIETISVHLGLTRSAARARAIGLLDAVGISAPTKRIDQFPHELSGGMRQRVAIAMAISCEPTLLIADEATTALDVTVQAEILELMLRLQKAQNMTLILITHDLGVAANYTDTIAVMYGGQLLEIGPTRSIFGGPTVPYTRALLNAVPRLSDPSHSLLRTIPGRARVFRVGETGCHFVARCKNATIACDKQRPPLVQAQEGQEFRCWNP
jgi:peptide/nickel transport system ATP-binding protein